METIPSNNVGQAFIDSIKHFPRWSFIIKISPKADRLVQNLKNDKFLVHTTLHSFVTILKSMRRLEFNGHILLTNNITPEEVKLLDSILPTDHSDIPLVLVLNPHDAETWYANAKFWDVERFLTYNGDTVNYYNL
jgi:hypothetical protein